MEEVFITKIKYKDIEFSIFMQEGKIIVKSKPDVAKELKQEVEKLVYDKFKTKKDDLNIKTPNQIFYGHLLAGSVGLIAGTLIGTFLKEDIETLKQKNKYNINLDTMQYEMGMETATFDDELFSKYVFAVYSNPNLTEEDKKEFVKRFNYINENKNSINKEEILNTLSTISVIRNDYDYPTNANILGEFKIINGKPVIALYEKATHETFIHEIYHALTYNTYYWDDVYFYNGQFLGTKEYSLLSLEEQQKCQKTEILGNMIEEAHTSILTAYEENTEKLNISYQQEVYIYKMYEKILGKENLEKDMLSANPVVGFLNGLLDIGCTKEEAIKIVADLDLYNTLKHNPKNLDLSYLTYQICDNLAYVYQKKYGNIDDSLLNITILSLTNNLNLDYAKEFENDFYNPELFNKIYTKKLTINNYLEPSIIANYGTNFRVNNIYIDYFSSSIPQVVVEATNYDQILLNVEGNEINFVGTQGDSDTSQYLYKLYTDYYTYAVNQFEKGENYAIFFAAIYANQSLAIEQKVELLDYYENWNEYIFFNENNQTKQARKILLLEDYDTIKAYFQNLSFENKIESR